MLRTFIFCLLCSLLSLSQASYSHHIISGDLTYRCLGGDVYEITLSIYSECGSQFVWEPFYPIKYYAEELGIMPNNPRSFNINKVSENEIQLLCNTAVTDCQTGSLRGVELVVYKGIVNLAGFSKARDWRFFWQRPARSKEITTLLFPEGEDFFVEASLNNLDVACNSSVTFKNSALATICMNQEYVFNNAAVDPNGDALSYSLLYSLATPKSSFDTHVIYDNGYDSAHFLPMSTTPHLDTRSGDLTFTADVLAIGVTDFKIEEYRDDVLIGWVRRAVQFNTIDCSNNLPELSDFLGFATDSISICAGESVALSFAATDPDPADSLTMSILSGKNGAYIIEQNNTNNPKGTISFSTTKHDAGVYNFVVNVSDNVCPQPGIRTKTYTVNVRELPNFELGADIIKNCSETVIIDPVITGGDENYSYLWSNNSNDTLLEVGPGVHYLTVTDGTGCFYTDSLTIFGELNPDFEADSLCVGATVQFTDLTEDLAPAKDAVAWSWDFGDGSTSDIQNAQHTYTASGYYDVTLSVTDDGVPPCTYSIEKPVLICDPPDFDINIIGYCTYSPIYVEIEELINQCDTLGMIEVDFGNGDTASCTDCSVIQNIYSIPGNYTVSVTGTNGHGCQATVSKSVEVLPSPIVDIIPDNFYLICSDPDSLIETQILSGGTGALTYLWNTGESTEDITINSEGLYIVSVTDEEACSLIDSIRVTYPLEALFSYDPFCNTNDIVSFHDSTRAYTNTITGWAWDFDDPASGVDNTSTDQNPQHTYSADGNYTVRLEVTDSDGCVNDTTGVVHNTLIDNFFEVLPAEHELCLGKLVTGEGPNGPNIDLYTWNLDEDSILNSKSIEHRYLSSGTFDMTLQVTYNNALLVSGACIADFAESIEVFPLPEAEIISSLDRYCMDEEGEFTFDGSDNIQSARWIFTEFPSLQSDTIANDTAIYTFDNRASYNIELTVTDANGCELKPVSTQFVDRIVIPDFAPGSERCAKEFIIFDEMFRDSLENITDYIWDFGDGESLIGQPPFAMTMHKYDTGGIYPVTLTISNRFSGCENSITKMLQVLYPPRIDFDYDTICSGGTMTFTNQTTNGDGEIAGYQWLFPDGTISETQNATFSFNQPGRFPISLISTSSLGCSDTLTQEVYVKEVPVAGIQLPPPFIKAFDPLQYLDDSEGDIIGYYWDFGDGTTSTEEDPIHTYNSIGQYQLTHVVTNALHCTDTLQSMLDLNVYLELPDAFSPNNDGVNDRLRFIQQGVETLHVLKIYNRYGKVVFDGGNNIAWEWDGTINNQPQPAGVYVTQVKATGAYGKEYFFKKNITLLR